MWNRIYKDDYMYSVYRACWDDNNYLRTLFDGDFKLFLFFMNNKKELKRFVKYV